MVAVADSSLGEVQDEQQPQQESETDEGGNNTTDGDEAALNINSAS